MLHYKPLARMLTVAAFLLVLSACSIISEDESSWGTIKNEGVLKVATSGTLYPTSYHDDNDGLTGYEVEIVREMASRLDLDVEFVEMGFDGMLPSVENGTVDMASNDITITEDRKDKFAYSLPIKYSYGGAIVRKEDLSGIQTLEDLKGKRAAGAASSIYMNLAEEYDAEAVYYDNATNDVYLRDVDNNQTDVILNDYYLQTLALKAFPQFDIVLHPDLFYLPNDQAVIMKKGNEELIKQVNEALQSMLEDGTVTELSKQFFDGADVSQKPDINFEEE
ncbi:amino acid ABC transporter substrate-binding protein (PAAT family) [Aureibacillus halotolerans]|uniref:Amino acid ABC transporter substrate-binding protein (PAAT family) n=2 Tax=Aureibacillus halotolerans TaxID=1508390 RepID=A0A4V3D663_9BACI|nr:amino acid ABC transporter substrate-binding protein (PAAT family) [Aureibacillus halotolerans]